MTVAEIITTAVAGIGVASLALFYKQIANGLVWVSHRFFVRVRKSYDLHVNCPGAEVMQALREIQAQLKTNGGSTMLDAIKRTERVSVIMMKEIRYLRIAHDLFTESINFPAFRTDAEGHTVWVNKVLKLIAGITDDEASGLGWLSMVHPTDRNRVRENWLIAIREQREYSDEYRIVAQPGDRILHIVSVAKPIRSEEGILGWSGTFKVVGGRRSGDELEVPHVLTGKEAVA